MWLFFIGNFTEEALVLTILKIFQRCIVLDFDVDSVTATKLVVVVIV